MAVTITMAALVIIVGIFSILIYQYIQEEPLRKQAEYLNLLKASFESTDELFSELLVSANVAGVKIQKVEDANADKQDVAFQTNLEDIEKMLSKIEATNRIFKDKKEFLESQKTPQSLADLGSHALGFYQKSTLVLNNLQKQFAFAKEMTVATGPKFYLSQLTDENLWQNPQKETIIAHYQQLKIDSDHALESLSKITPPENYKAYYDTQLAYLQLLVTLSNDIINVLSISEDLNEDNPNQTEKAYQLLVNAQKENSQLQKKLLEEKIQIVDTKQIINKLAPIETERLSVYQQLSFQIESSQKPKNLLPKIPNFLQALQTPH